MSARLPGALAVGLLVALFALAAATVTGPALAVEEDELQPEEEAPPPPDIEELCIEGTIAEEFCPEAYEEPSWFQWLIYPMLGLGLLVVTVLVIFYLWWQPRFAREQEDSQRGGR